MRGGPAVIACVVAILVMSADKKPVSVTCLCGEKQPVDTAYKYTDLVVKGRIVGEDTVFTNEIFHSKKGVKTGNHRYTSRSYRMLRITFVVEKNFKSPFPIPDTIFVLTDPDPSACGAHFMPYLKDENIPREFYNYIIYAGKWEDISLITHKVGKKTRGEIKRVLSSNTFVTSSCTRTRMLDPDELEKLNKIRH